MIQCQLGGHTIYCGWLSETIFAFILPKNQISAEFRYIEKIQALGKAVISYQITGWPSDFILIRIMKCKIGFQSLHVLKTKV
jgi:hypothetical protein